MNQLEPILREMESNPSRDSGLYYFSVFGEPSDTGTWGFRVEGHHVSQNFTIVNGKVADTPSFFGANPAEVREGPRKGLRVLAAEEDLARDLLESLTADQKKVAIVSPEAYKDILTAASRKAALEGQPSGIAAEKMTKKQTELLMTLLAEYAHNVPDQLAHQFADFRVSCKVRLRRVKSERVIFALIVVRRRHFSANE